MSTELVKPTAEEAAALDRIDTELKALRSRSGEAAAAEVDFCATYKALKEPLKIAVKLLRRIPVVGDKLADALEFLMSVADAFCTA